MALSFLPPYFAEAGKDPQVVEAARTIALAFAGASVGFVALDAAAHARLAAVPAYARRPPVKQAEIRSNVLAGIHALFVAGFGFYKIYLCPESNLTGNVAINGLTLANFVTDLWLSRAVYIPSLRSAFWHHILGCGLIFGAIPLMPLLQFRVPHMMWLEASTVPLNAMLLVREFRGPRGAAYWAATGAFVASFFAIRIVFFGRLVHEFWAAPRWAPLHGWPMVALGTTMALQCYWGLKILAMVRRAFLKRGVPDAGKARGQGSPSKTE